MEQTCHGFQCGDGLDGCFIHKREAVQCSKADTHTGETAGADSADDAAEIAVGDARFLQQCFDGRNELCGLLGLAEAAGGELAIHDQCNAGADGGGIER